MGIECVYKHKFLTNIHTTESRIARNKRAINFIETDKWKRKSFFSEHK